MINAIVDKINASKAKPLDYITLSRVKKLSNAALDGLENNLLSTVKNHSPDLVQKLDCIEYVPHQKLGARMVDCGKDLLNIPIEFVDWMSNIFPGIKNTKLIQNYEKRVEFDRKLRASEGIYRKSADFLNGCKHNISDADLEPGGKVYEEYVQNSKEILNEAMDLKKSNYDTKKERFLTRIVSGFTAAVFLGSDFYNKPISKGKTEDEAKKAQHKKQFQEVKENLLEGFVTFGVSTIFAKAINSKVWASALIGALVSFGARVISRLSSGMPLFRQKIPDNSNQNKYYSIDNFIESLQNNDVEFERNNMQVKQDNADDEHILNFDNILKFCALSIGIGFGFRKLRADFSISGSKSALQIREAIKKHNAAIKEKDVRIITASKDEIKNLANCFTEAGETKIAEFITKIPSDNKTGLIYIGEEYKTNKLFNKFEVNNKDLRALKTAPLRFIKELAMYPYKLVLKLSEAAGWIKKKEKPELADPHNIANIYLKYEKFKEKYADNPDKLSLEFSEYIKKMRLASYDDLKTSKIDNSKIAVMAQTMGTLMGMGFNMNDEFNASVKNGSTKEEAEKDARLRGINKFFRMCVQVIISGSLNDIFKRQYNNSLLGSGIIVAISTILTDAASRFLSGMPTTKMTKEELDNYQEKQKNGILKGYYKLIDKLAS